LTWIGVDIGVCVVCGALQSVKTESDKTFFEEELEELVISLVDLLFRNDDLPQVRG
jgi:hypothetical protein